MGVQMSDLKSVSKIKLERLFGMSSGYVLDFSDRTFQAFILENMGDDIYNEHYNYNSGSKANRLRAYWNIESNKKVAKLNKDLLEYIKALKINNLFENQKELFNDCLEICEKLEKLTSNDEVRIIEKDYNIKDIELLIKHIKQGLEDDEPEIIIDRLHTFLVKYVRSKCDKNNIKYDNEKPIHSLFGEYVKFLKDKRIIESETTGRILKSTISIIDSYNNVRNTQSLAHDNPILNKNESRLIIKGILNIIEFIETIDK